MNQNNKTQEGVAGSVNTGSIPEKSTPVSPKMRQVIIETDGNSISLVKAEVSGKIELVGILQNLIAFINQQK